MSSLYAGKEGTCNARNSKSDPDILFEDSKDFPWAKKGGHIALPWKVAVEQNQENTPMASEAQAIM